MRGTAQRRAHGLVLDLYDRADDRQKGDRKQPRDHERDQPEHHEHDYQQVGEDQADPRQGLGDLPDRGALLAVLGRAHDPAQEARQEDRSQDLQRRGGQLTGDRQRHVGVVDEVRDRDVRQHGQQGHRDGDGQDPPRVVTGRAGRRGEEAAHRQRRAGALLSRLAAKFTTGRHRP